MYMKKKANYMPSYKIIVAGSKGVGKSQIVKQYIDLSFSTQYNPTESFVSYNKIVNLNQGKDLDPILVRLNIVDTYITHFTSRFPINHKYLSSNPKTLTGEAAEAAKKMLAEQEKLYRHKEIGSLEKEAYGFVFVYESGNQASFDDVKWRRDG